MKLNVGKIDKYARILLGVTVIGLGVYFQSWWGVIGIIPLATALSGWCPVYSIFGVSTCPVKENK